MDDDPLPALQNRGSQPHFCICVRTCLSMCVGRLTYSATCCSWRCSSKRTNFSIWAYGKRALAILLMQLMLVLTHFALTLRCAQRALCLAAARHRHARDMIWGSVSAQGGWTNLSTHVPLHHKLVVFKAQLGELFLEMFHLYFFVLFCFIFYWQNWHVSPKNRRLSGQNRHFRAQTGT